MDRGGWTVWALSATLIAVALGANAVLMVHDMAGVFQEQSKVFPEDRPWFFRGAGIMMAAASVVFAATMTLPAYGWGKVRAKGKQAKVEPKPLFPEDDEEDKDPLQMPPGFASGPRLRTRRHGLVPLVGFNLLGLGLLLAGAALVYIGVLQFVATSGMQGSGFKTAVLWGRIVRFGGLPLLGMAGLSLGAAWGRWFPLGEVEVIQEATATREARPTRATWDRQG